MKILYIFILMMGFFGVQAVAQDNNKIDFENIAGELRCPTCTGLSVLDSDAEFSNKIKDIVKEKLKEGKNKDQILEFFVGRYGPWILREPPKEGLNLLAWLIPLLVIILGPLFVWFRFWKHQPNKVDYQLVSREEILEKFHKELKTIQSKKG